MIDLYETSGMSPSRAALARVAHLFDGPHRMTSVRVDSPEEFPDLPARFALVRRGGASWLVDTSAPYVSGGRA